MEAATIAFELECTLGVLFADGDLTELRATLPDGRNVNGYYASQVELARDAAKLNDKHQANVFVCLNPIRPERYASSDRKETTGICGKGEATKNSDVAFRRWLLVDIDPQRPAGTSATEEQRREAQAVAGEVYTWLKYRLGDTCLLVADSGNGKHILIRLPDVPANNQSKWICTRLLRRLDDLFSTPEAKVDLTTASAARICTLYGSFKRKGEHTEATPHRQSKFLRVPSPAIEAADWDTLAGLVDPYPGDRLPDPPESNGNGMRYDIPAILAQHPECPVSDFDDNLQTDRGEIAQRWELEVCPFNVEHNDRSAYLLQWSNGAVCFGCHHDGCDGRDWQALRELWSIPSPGVTREQITGLDPPAKQQQAAPIRPELLIVSSLDIVPEDIDWLWQDRFVMGGINLCAGRGGIGKTYFLTDLVARITTEGAPAPNGQPLRHGRVLYSTGEDHIAKVLEPRMRQHNLDGTRLEYVKGLPEGEYVRLLDVVNHCDLLRDALRKRPDTVALVLDPISSFQGELDGNKTAQVRRFTAVLTQLAEEADIAVIGIHHFSKAKRDVAGDAISGSHAYRDASRSIWLYALDGNDPTRRLMVCDKHNWAPERPTGLAFRIEAGRIVYEPDPLDMTSNELMAMGTQRPIDVAESWLIQQLAAGPQPSVNIKAGAALAGIKERTLERAKKELGITSTKEGEHWLWALPQE